jgi:hypothetical protein
MSVLSYSLASKNLPELSKFPTNTLMTIPFVKIVMKR